MKVKSEKNMCNNNKIIDIFVDSFHRIASHNVYNHLKTQPNKNYDSF